MIEAIILKLWLTQMEIEEYKEQHFSNYAVYTTYEEEPEDEQPACFYIRIERW